MISNIDGNIYLNTSSKNDILSPRRMYGIMYSVCKMYEIKIKTTTFDAFHIA